MPPKVWCFNVESKRINKVTSRSTRNHYMLCLKTFLVLEAVWGILYITRTYLSSQTLVQVVVEAEALPWLP